MFTIDPAISFPNAWPDGTYSMPEHKSSGCPESDGFFWRTGYVHQDNEDKDNENSCPSFEFKGSCLENLEVYYCSKTVTSGDVGINWPRGSYCIVAKGNCPTGFDRGSVYWDDEDSNNKNKISGIVPDGSYGSNTRIYYCCRDDSHPHNPITLPTGKKFFLLKFHRDGCQEVNGMRVAERKVRTDDEDNNNNNKRSSPYPYGVSGSNNRLTYCYYY